MPKPALWQVKRQDTLTVREKNAFEHYENNPDKYLNTIFKATEILSTGYIRAPRLDFPIAEIISYNKYEGIRPGIGFSTNDGISKSLRAGGYVGFGLEDEALKYGGHLRFQLSQSRNTSLTFFFKQDLSEPASTVNIDQDQEAGFFKDSYRGLITSRMDSIQVFGAMLSSSISHRIKLKFSFLREERNPTYSYQHINDDVNTDPFKVTAVSTTVRYATGEKHINLGGLVFPISKPKLLFEMKFSKTLDLASDNLSYLKIHAQAGYRFNTKLLGETSLWAMGGMTNGNVPYSYLFNGRGTSQSITFFYLPNTFQTMRVYEFLADRYASLFVSQNLGRLLFRTGSRYSSPEFLITNGVYWGDLKQADQHTQLKFKTPERGFAESGMIVNKFLRIPYLNVVFLDFGVGAFYRYGPYAFSHQRDNLAFKLMIGASL